LLGQHTASSHDLGFVNFFPPRGVLLKIGGAISGRAPLASITFSGETREYLPTFFRIFGEVAHFPPPYIWGPVVSPPKI